MRRRPLLTALAATPFLAAPFLATGARAAERVLQVVAPWDVGTLEPSRAGYVFTRLQVSETLVAADPEGRLVPALAESWSADADGLSWRFALRRGTTFHDGTPLSAAVAAAMLRRCRSLPGPFGKTPVAAIEAEGGDVLIRLSSPFSALPAFLAHYSTQVLAPAAFDAAGTVRTVIGTGPYRVSGLGLPLRIDVERFDGWSGPRPAIARASYLSVPRAEARALMAESGQADLAFTLDPPSLGRLRPNNRVSVRLVPIPRMELLKLNAGAPPFDDVRVRRAVSLGIDRAGVARAILGNPGAAATQLFPPSLADWHQPDLSPLRHDPAEARRLLDEAGWRPGPGGMRARNGVPFQTTLRTYADRPELPVVATAIQDGLRGLGLGVEVMVVNSSEIPAGHADGTLQMALMARNFALVPDPVGTLIDDYGSRGGDWGAMGWSDETLNAALAALQRGDGAEAAARHRAAVARALHEGLPSIPVAWYDHSAVVNRRLEGVVIDPFELSYNLSAMRWAG